MEFTIVSAVYNLAVGITHFISEHEDIDVVNQEISSIATLIQNIIHPLLSRKITNSALQQCLQGLQSELSNTHEHMKMWKERRSRRMLALINPWAVTQQLKDDRDQLMARYTLLMGAMQVVNHIEGYNMITPSRKNKDALPDGPPGKKKAKKKKKVKEKASEVLDFWEKCIGKESGSVKGDYLCQQLSSWMGTTLDEVASQRLLLRLDHNNTGYVTLATLQDLVQNGNMKEIINTYSADPTLPLLIWIDNDILGKARQALRARKAGITVVQIGSTSAAKTWIKINRKFLRKHDNPADIRFVSDQVRTEFSRKGVSYTNRSAGQEMTKFIRKAGFRAPILIFTTKSGVHLTRYVESYSMVGSLENSKEFGQYVYALGARRTDDTQWAKYGGP